MEQTPIGKLLLKLSPPVMLALLIQSIYNIVDSYFVAQYSEAGLTALSIIYPIQLLMVALATGAGAGINILVSRMDGTGECARQKDVVKTGLWLGLVQFVAFAAVGLAGLTRKAKHGLALGALVGGAARFVVHFISGVTIYKIMEPTELYGLVFSNPWIYSLAYNIGYMLPSTLLAELVCLLLEKPMSRLPGGSRA